MFMQWGLGFLLAGVAHAVSVNPFIGTGGLPTAAGMTFPGATLPFGLIRLSPDTRYGGFLTPLNHFNTSTSGYAYEHERVLGFSHTRLSGTGAREGGLFRVSAVPTIGYFKNRQNGVKFGHAGENAEPGRYEAILPEQKIGVELTTTLHCGIHRYRRLEASSPLQLLIDATSSLSKSDSRTLGNIQIDPSARILRGQTRLFDQFSGRVGGLPAFFYAEYSPSVQNVRLWQDQALLTPDAPFSQGKNVGAILSPSPESKNIELSLCISFVSAKNAELNFEAEARGKTLEQVRDQAAQIWNQSLARISIRSASPKVLTAFYTSLYHALLMPTHFTDVNGDYLGFDGAVHQARGFIYRTDFSLWDTFRTAHPLYSLIAPEIQRDSVLSLLEMGKINGVLPRWPSGAGDSGSMFGSPANFVISEAYLKGIRDFDTSTALQLMIDGATRAPRANIPGREPACQKLGYCPSDQVNVSVSQTLEYAWADSAIAEFATALDKTEIASEFNQRAESFQRLWNPETRYFQPKNASGEFQPFMPELLSYVNQALRFGNHYSEGSAFHWRFSAPHRSAELIQLFGGNDAFTAELDRFMRGATPRIGELVPSARYWHGNEHDIHALYLFNDSGHPELTQKWARWALQTRYGNAPAGLDGNDDGGTLSAWYVLSALGLYPQAGTAHYWLGSPIIDQATLDLGGGHHLEIIAHDQSDDRPYVKQVLLNGQKVCRPQLRHEDLVDAKLEFFMIDTPAPNGGYGCK